MVPTYHHPIDLVSREVSPVAHQPAAPASRSPTRLDRRRDHRGAEGSAADALSGAPSGRDRSGSAMASRPARGVRA